MYSDALVLVRGIQIAVGVVILFSSYRIYRWIRPVQWDFMEYNSSGWMLMGGTGLVLSGFTGLTLLLERTAPAYSYVAEAIGTPVFSVVLALALTFFVSSESARRRPDGLTVRNVVRYSVLVVIVSTVVGGITYGASPAVFTVLYLSTLFLLLPAIGAAHILHGNSRVPLWTAFLLGSYVLYASVVLDMYATAFCGTGGSAAHQPVCNRYAYTLPAIEIGPAFDPLIYLATAGPVITTAAILVIGSGAWLFYRHIYVPAGTGSGRKDRQIQQLIDGTVATLGSIIGKPVAQTIAKTTIEDRFDDIQVSFSDSGKTTIQMSDRVQEDQFSDARDALIDGFTAKIGPVAEREINNVADQIHPADRSTS